MFFATAAAVLLAATVAKAEQPSTTFRDAGGRTIGTATTDANGTKTFRDANGRITGTATRDSNGTTTFREATGRTTGTASPPRRRARPNRIGCLRRYRRYGTSTEDCGARAGAVRRAAKDGGNKLGMPRSQHQRSLSTSRARGPKRGRPGRSADALGGSRQSRGGLGPAALASRSRHQWRCALEASPPASTPAMVLHHYNTQHLLLGAKAAPEFSLRQGGHSPLLTALGELHGRNLASAFMRSRVHNRTSDRGGKPIRLAWPWARPRSLRKDRGRSPKNSPPTNLVTTVTPKRKQCRNV